MLHGVDGGRRVTTGVATAFDGCAGVFHAAPGSTAVLMIGSWGFEALCLAAARRLLAESLAAAGYPTLRYDHPGTGDSLDDAGIDLTRWVDAMAGAADHVLALSGARRLVVIADGLGAAVALSAAERLPSLEGAVFLAPVLSGRSHLREVRTHAAMIGGGSETGAAIAGIHLPDRVAADLASLDVRTGGLHVPRALVVARPGRETEARLAERIETLAGHADALPFADYDAALTDPTRAVPPRATWTAVVDWLTAAVPPSSSAAPAPVAPIMPPVPVLDGGTFLEEGLRFGPGERLFGILATPSNAVRGPGVVIANAGRDPHTGWARFGVELSRRLASAGFPVLRIDLSGIGESPAPPGREQDELLYSSVHQDDLREAADLLVRRGAAAVVLAGRCSGAFAAFHAAPTVERLRAVFAINLLRVIWDPREDVATAIVADIRPLGSIARKALDPRSLLRLLKGEIDPRNLVRRVVAHLRDGVARRGPAAMARRRAAEDIVAALSRRRATVRFVSGDTDIGLSHIADAFGGLERVATLPGASLLLLEGADHNLTSPAARNKIYDDLLRILTTSSS